VDGLVVLYCETAMTNPKEIAQAIHAAVTETGITDKPVTVSFVGGERSDKAMEWLVENGIPAYGAPDLAVNAMGALREYGRMLDMSNNKPFSPEGTDSTLARRIITQARTNGRGALTEIEAKKVFQAYGLPIADTDLARTEAEAVSLAKRMVTLL
jgi:acetyltransferase